MRGIICHCSVYPLTFHRAHRGCVALQCSCVGKDLRWCLHFLSSLELRIDLYEIANARFQVLLDSLMSVRFCETFRCGFVGVECSLRKLETKLLPLEGGCFQLQDFGSSQIVSRLKPFCSHSRRWLTGKIYACRSLTNFCVGIYFDGTKGAFVCWKMWADRAAKPSQWCGQRNHCEKCP